MDEIDELLESASVKWFAYGVLFGKHKPSNEPAFATVIISAYIDKYTPIQRKFEAPTLALAIEEVKKWIYDNEYVQVKPKPDAKVTPMASIAKKKVVTPKLFDGL